MKLGTWIKLGIFLSVIGVGSIAVACIKVDFHQEFRKILIDPSLEEKTMDFEKISTVVYEGNADSIEFCYHEEGNSFQYYEGRYITYDIEYEEDTKALIIKQNYKNHIGFSWKEKSILYLHDELESLDVKVNAGNVSMKDVHTKSLQTEVDCGNLVIRSMKGMEATISTSAGNLDMEDCIFNSLSLTVNTGNLSFSGDILHYGKMKVDLGNMTLKLKQQKEAYTMNDQGQGSVKIDYAISLGTSKISYANE